MSSNIIYLMFEKLASVWINQEWKNLILANISSRSWHGGKCTFLQELCKYRNQQLWNSFSKLLHTLKADAPDTYCIGSLQWWIWLFEVVQILQFHSLRTPWIHILCPPLRGVSIICLRDDVSSNECLMIISVLMVIATKCQNELMFFMKEEYAVARVDINGWDKF